VAVVSGCFMVKDSTRKIVFWWHTWPPKMGTGDFSWGWETF